MERKLLCYRLIAWVNEDYDPEEIWSLVQRHGGELAIRRDSIDFFMPPQYKLVIELSYPELCREPALDYTKVYHYFNPMTGLRLPSSDPDYRPDP